MGMPRLKDETMSTDTPTAKRYTTGQLPVHEAKKQADRAEALLAAHQRAGGVDMTNVEMCEAYQRVYGETLYPHHGMARLNNLEAANRVVCDRENKRPCSVTGKLVQTYTVPLLQVRLCA
jgi:hypothetical protein